VIEKCNACLLHIAQNGNKASGHEVHLLFGQPALKEGHRRDSVTVTPTIIFSHFRPVRISLTANNNQWSVAKL
jgi:hypothetical protein